MSEKEKGQPDFQKQLKKKDTYIKQLEYRVSELQIENEEQRNNRNSFNQSISFLEEQIFVKD